MAFLPMAGPNPIFQLRSPDAFPGRTFDLSLSQCPCSCIGKWILFQFLHPSGFFWEILQLNAGKTQTSNGFSLSCSVAPFFPFFLVAAPLKWSSQKRVPFFSRVTELSSCSPAAESYGVIGPERLPRGSFQGGFRRIDPRGWGDRLGSLWVHPVHHSTFGRMLGESNGRLHQKMSLDAPFVDSPCSPSWSSFNNLVVLLGV